METDRFKYFCTIVETGSLSKAADLLGVSHSGLSKAMSVLKNELGCDLFRPQGRGLEITEEGREVYDKCKSVLAGIEGLRLKGKKLSQVIRIGVQEVLSHSLTGKIVASLEGEIELFELDSGEIEVSLLEGKIDFGFTFVPFPQKGIEYLKIAKAAFGSFCKRGSFRNVAPEDIPYVIPSSELKGNPLSFKFRDGWNKNIPRFSPYKADNLSAALNIVQEGVAAIYIPKFLAKSMNSSLNANGHLVEVPMPSERQTAEVTWREIFLIKMGHETKEMKRVTRVIRLALNS